ncbi:related to integral membrane protein [Fusarium torulosum]|uniref:Related to integral membrane protein n=1 Tax=Fusarium torulosum TaxID=33205 RepID=A0AAE8MM56_9HYPO|nr:related to integral membrane protein [Fusarium torulosum]
MSGITTLTLPHAGLSLLLDIWMLVLPLTQLWGLGLKIRKKLGVIAMFSVGIFLTIVAAIRVHELAVFARSADLTVTNAQKAIIWSSVEISVGIMVACMPHVRHLVRHVASRIRGEKGGEMEHNNQQVFVDRSLATITVDDATGTTVPQLYDEGGLLEKNITVSTAAASTAAASTATAAVTESRNTGSLGYSSDAETQV